MAGYKPGPNVLDMSGSIGQVTYCTLKSGSHYLKQRPQVVRNPQSPAQTAMREAFPILTRMYRTFSDQVRAQWALIAEKGITRGNPEGGIRVLIKTPKGRPTASNVFVGANQLAKSVGQTTVITAPQTRLLVPMTPPNLRAVFVPDGPNSRLTVQWDDVLKATADDFVRVWVKSEQKLCHRQMALYAPALDKQVNITSVRIQYGTPADMGFFIETAMLIQADTVGRSSGWASSPSNTLRLYLAR